MFWEAKGDFNQAEAAYKAILLEQPNNEMALKRQVRVHPVLPWRSEGLSKASLDPAALPEAILLE